MLWPQAAADGSLGVLINKVRSQPQVFTAYSKVAAIRDRACAAEFSAIVTPLKVHIANTATCLGLASIDCRLSVQSCEGKLLHGSEGAAPTNATARRLCLLIWPLSSAIQNMPSMKATVSGMRAACKLRHASMSVTHQEELSKDARWLCRDCSMSSCHSCSLHQRPCPSQLQPISRAAQHQACRQVQLQQLSSSTALTVIMLGLLPRQSALRVQTAPLHWPARPLLWAHLHHSPNSRHLPRSQHRCVCSSLCQHCLPGQSLLAAATSSSTSVSGCRCCRLPHQAPAIAAPACQPTLEGWCGQRGPRRPAPLKLPSRLFQTCRDTPSQQCSSRLSSRHLQNAPP